jgi:hypothetical protein
MAGLAVLLLAGPALISPHAPAQSAAVRSSAPRQTVTVVVVKAHPLPVQPVPTVRVSLSYLDGATQHHKPRHLSAR